MCESGIQLLICLSESLFFLKCQTFFEVMVLLVYLSIVSCVCSSFEGWIHRKLITKVKNCIEWNLCFHFGWLSSTTTKTAGRSCSLSTLRWDLYDQHHLSLWMPFEKEPLTFIHSYRTFKLPVTTFYNSMPTETKNTYKSLQHIRKLKPAFLKWS